MAPERETTAKESKQKNSWGIDISWGTTKLKLLNYFGRHVRRCPTEEFDFLGVRNLCAEAEVNEFYVPMLIKHNIFELDVSMSYAFRV